MLNAIHPRSLWRPPKHLLHSLTERLLQPCPSRHQGTEGLRALPPDGFPVLGRDLGRHRSRTSVALASCGVPLSKGKGQGVMDQRVIGLLPRVVRAWSRTGRHSPPGKNKRLDNLLTAIVERSQRPAEPSALPNRARKWVRAKGSIAPTGLDPSEHRPASSKKRPNAGLRFRGPPGHAGPHF